MSWLYGNFHFFLCFYPKLGVKPAFLADKAACLSSIVIVAFEFCFNPEQIYRDSIIAKVRKHFGAEFFIIT